MKEQKPEYDFRLPEEKIPWVAPAGAAYHVTRDSKNPGRNVYLMADLFKFLYSSGLTTIMHGDYRDSEHSWFEALVAIELALPLYYRFLDYPLSRDTKCETDNMLTVRSTDPEAAAWWIATYLRLNGITANCIVCSDQTFDIELPEIAIGWKINVRSW